ncbi:NAD(P)/FAD-dependent oxidoreductase [Bacillus solimangrovi]|uniref:NADH dehydrogenase n=1 Tax=Bacillus solimangrovi TaxID=1305675 RepID=A0A1E5LIS1_9BACI|nr:NAD(P)/FAD-dependent oxidoreductase [Bacillus solimangrovi]OEH93982.1 NADH dehydrogenase [Bacillus solimangrovi]
MKNLVILGGGYGGMRILQRIFQHIPSDINVILVDRMPYHGLKTEYYALAAGTISDKHTRVDFPTHPQLSYRNANVSEIDIENNKIHFSNGEDLEYEDLIIGLGCEDKYHNVPGADKYTYSIQTIENARNAYQALNNLNKNELVCIVGGGLSGVEMASELRESRPDIRIKLLDRGTRILSSFPEKLSNYVEGWFHEHDVEIVHNANITKVESNTLYNNDEAIDCGAIVWTAGIQPNKIVGNLNVEKDQYGRVVLTEQHHLLDNEHVFVVGDCASLPHAPSAQLAEGQAEQIAVVLAKRWNNEAPPESFPPIKLKGVLGSLGKKSGFGVLKDTALTGRVPRLLKSGVLWMYKNHNG